MDDLVAPLGVVAAVEGERLEQVDARDDRVRRERDEAQGDGAREELAQRERERRAEEADEEGGGDDVRRDFGGAGELGGHGGG